MIKNLLIDHIKNNVPDNEIAVLLSGGIDSLSCAIVAHDAGKIVNAYSFHLDTHETYDYHKAKEVSEIMGWNFTGVSVPTNDLENDWFRLVELGCKKKTHYECVYPFLYVYPKIKEKYVLSGWAADGYYGLSKKAKINYSQTKELQVAFMDNYFRKENQAGYLWHKKIVDDYKKILITPYLTQPVKEYFYKRDWVQLNKPKQKNHIREAFAKEFDLVGKIKNHQPLQGKVSKVTELFETLLENKDINFNGRKEMKWVCYDYKDGIPASLF